MCQKFLFQFTICSALVGFSSVALAWNPNAGAEAPSAYNSTPSNIANTVVPQRYYNNQSLAPLPNHTAYSAQPIYTNPSAPSFNATGYNTPSAVPAQPVANAQMTAPPAAPTPGYATYQPTPISNAAAAPIYNPLPAAQPTPITYAPAPAQAAAIAVQPAPIAVQAPPAPAVSAAIPAAPPIAISEPMPDTNLIRNNANNLKRTRYAVGGELFYDNYQEPDTFPDLHNNAYYGSLAASLTHDFSPRWFGGLDGRISYGSQDYSSNSGTINGVPQWELESRAITGYTGLLNSGSRIKPYIGLGVRYYLDQSEGEVTSLGALGYDRSILQFYAPIGVSYEFETDGLTIIPNIEINPLLYGSVESGLGSIPGYSDAKNKQTQGIGWRAEVMVSKLHNNGTGWQFGPFIRYWNIEDSDDDTISTPSGPSRAIEPKNTRMQLGAKLKYLF